MQMKTNKNGVKLLAAVMVIAMALSVSIVVFDDSSDAKIIEAGTYLTMKTDGTVVDTWEEVIEELSKNGASTILLDIKADDGTIIDPVVLNDGLTIPADKTLVIGNEFDRGTTDSESKPIPSFSITIPEGKSLTINGALYNNVGKSASTSALVINGSLVLSGEGSLYSMSALKFGANSNIVGFFTNSDGQQRLDNSTLQYKHMYSADITKLIDYVNPADYTNEIIKPSDDEVKAIFTYGDVSISGTVDLATPGIILALGGNGGNDATITLVKDSVVKATLVNTKDGASVSLPGIKAGEKGIVLSQGSIVVGGEIATDASGNITVLSGNAKLVADVPAGITITVNDRTTLEIPEGVTITNKGTITNNGTTNIYGVLANEGSVAGNNAVTISGEDAKIEGTAPATTPEVIIDKTGKTPISTTILAFEGDVIIDGDAYLIGDLEIPAEKKLIIRSTGTLDLGGYGLTINGEFIVESGAKVFGSDAGTASDDKNTIILMKGASIQNDGVLGAIKAVTVKVGSVENKYDGVGEVKLLNGSGVEFGLANTTAVSASIAQYTLTVTGDIYSDVTSKIEMKDVRIINEMTIGENVTLSVPAGDVKVYLMNGATLNVDGVMAVDNASKFIMKNKSTVVMDGVLVGKISAETGEYKTSDGWVVATGYTSVSIAANSDYASFETTNKTNGMTGFTLSVGTISYQKTISSVKTAMTYQALYIDGDLDYIFVKADGSAPDTSVSMTIYGNSAYVSADSTIVLKKQMDIKITETTTSVGGTPADSSLYVLGQVVANSASVAGVDKYIGASYTIKGTTSDSNITYIEPFASAITKIADADGKKVTVTEDVEIDGSLTILENQVLDIKSKFTVKETGILTVDAKGKIIGTIDSVEGVLKVMKNGTCSAPTSYASVTKSTDYTQYSGLKIAIQNAQPGETITIVSPAEVSDLEIPAGVTVESSAKITVKGNMTIAETAKVVLKDGTGEIDITKEKAKLTVNGELDASEGKVTLTGTGAQIYSDGKTVIANSQNALLTSSNAFVYVNDENQYVLTNAEDAIAAVAAMDVAKNVDVYGTVSAGDIELKTDMDIKTGATVIFGNVTIADGKEITINGKVTGTFSVVTGIPETTGATATSTIDLQKASGIVIGATSEVDAQNVRTYIFFIYGDLIGTADVTAGTVSVGKDGSTAGTTDTITVNKTTNKDAYLTIDEGATLSVRSGMDLIVGCNDASGYTYPAVIVDGTLDVVKGGEIKSATNGGGSAIGILDISGTFAIGNSTTVEFNGMILMEGVIEISTTENKEGKLVAGGDIIMFDGASISGKIDITIANYILAYVGADVSKAQINVTAGESVAFATAFYINSDICMTAYAITGSNVKTFDVIESAEFDVPGYDLSNIKKTTTETGTTTYWYTDADLEDEVDTDDTDLVKTVPAVYFNAPKATVTGTISAGVGLQIYLNGISVENYKVGTGYTLPVGTYKVTIENLSGYDKTNAVISFNGATVADGGSITISEKGFVLTATGAVPSVTPTPEPTPIQPSEKDDGMGLTEYLLIVLVILAAILVVVVAIRMMRS